MLCLFCDAQVREDSLSSRRWCLKCELEFEALQTQLEARKRIEAAAALLPPGNYWFEEV